MNDPLEKDIQNSCCEYLSFKKYFFWRQNTTPMFNKERQQYRAMPKYALKGVADIIVIIPEGKVIFLEVKRPKAKQNEDQLEFEKMCNKVEAKYYVITSIDDLIKLGL